MGKWSKAEHLFHSLVSSLEASGKIKIDYLDLLRCRQGRGHGSGWLLAELKASAVKGVRRVFVFSDEWGSRQSIVDSKLRLLTGDVSTFRRIGARECDLAQVDRSEANPFLAENHLQGASAGSLSFGLRYGEELVAVMTFSSPSVAKGGRGKYGWEMVRYAAAVRTLIPGGASRLWKCFLRRVDPESVVSFADRRWSGGGLYEQLGLKMDHISGPNYWYFRVKRRCPGACPVRVHRYSYTKHAIKRRFPEQFNADESEYQNMLRLGYDRVWDCGNLVFVWRRGIAA